MLSLIEEIVAKCGEVQDSVEFLKTLAGKANDPKWVIVDPGYARLKEMARAQVDAVIVLAGELRALIT